jgi:hypothetical protein
MCSLRGGFGGMCSLRGGFGGMCSLRGEGHSAVGGTCRSCPQAAHNCCCCVLPCHNISTTHHPVWLHAPAGGAGLTTYRELCSLANEMGQPDLIYRWGGGVLRVIMCVCWGGGG